MLAIGQNHEHDRRVVLIVFETGDQFHPKKSNKKKQNKTKQNHLIGNHENLDILERGVRISRDIK